MDSTSAGSVVRHFKDLQDPRIECAKPYRLIEIMVTALGFMMVFRKHGRLVTSGAQLHRQPGALFKAGVNNRFEGIELVRRR